jgi:hypothetical protein
MECNTADDADKCEAARRITTERLCNTCHLRQSSPTGCILLNDTRGRRREAMLWLFSAHRDKLTSMRSAVSAFNSQSKLMLIHAHLSLSLLFELTKSCHLTKSRCLLHRSKFHDLPRLCETQPSAAQHFRRHEIFGHRDSQPDSKSIFSLSHTALLGLPQPRVSISHILLLEVCLEGDASAS